MSAYNIAGKAEPLPSMRSKGNSYVLEVCQHTSSPTLDCAYLSLATFPKASSRRGEQYCFPPNDTHISQAPVCSAAIEGSTEVL
jgi:hypothetical protein